jgi:hypothetical protein
LRNDRILQGTLASGVGDSQRDPTTSSSIPHTADRPRRTHLSEAAPRLHSSTGAAGPPQTPLPQQTSRIGTQKSTTIPRSVPHTVDRPPRHLLCGLGREPEHEGLHAAQQESPPRPKQKRPSQPN